jgi:hypothetical protein
MKTRQHDPNPHRAFIGMCRFCMHSREDGSYRRCYSPQLIAAGLAGRLIQFEADGFDEPTRHGPTRKCGQRSLNHLALVPA